MKLLICTQAVDKSDPVLGFFHRWIEEFAKHCESIEVICLREGTHTFPKNVSVYSLGKEKGIPRFFRWMLALWYIVVHRRKYDAVFVHMNPEYLVLAGWFWRLRGIKSALWYTHKTVNLKLRIATFFANRVFTASKESFRLHSKKIEVLGHGIDTDFFSPDPSVSRGDTILSVGRLSPSKRHDLAIRAAALAGRELCIVGAGPEREVLESLAQSLGTRVNFLGGLTQEQLRDEYRKASYLVHTSETGSLDKVVLEALATDLSVITTSGAYQNFPVDTVSATPEDIAQALRVQRVSAGRVQSIREHHSLLNLIPRILAFL